ncbi:MAG: VWA domain-containing protein [Clostridia bacterium]|nr:VWA domain-containing protein [Clostridia bacterium]
MKTTRKIISIVLAVLFLMSAMIVPASAAGVSPNASKKITRYNVLVLDMSGSMDGEPLKQLKIGCKKFVDDLFTKSGDDNYVAIVTFSSSASIKLSFSNDKSAINTAIDSLSAYGMTNISDGINKAVSLYKDLFSNQGVNANNVISNILVMSDGLPNEGTETVSGFESLMNTIHQSYNTLNFYSFGYYHNLSSSNITSAEEIMSVIGDYTRVSDGSSLKFDFGELAPVNGVTIRIACPVDVEVSLDGSTVKLNKANTHTFFGDLTFENNGETKILTLQYRENYTIKITGTGTGKMDYSLTYTLNGGEIRTVSFSSVDITPSTIITSTFNDDTFNQIKKEVLNIDVDGDGRIDSQLEPGTGGGNSSKKTSVFDIITGSVLGIIFAPFILLFYAGFGLFSAIFTIVGIPFALIASLFS